MVMNPIDEAHPPVVESFVHIACWLMSTSPQPHIHIYNIIQLPISSYLGGSHFLDLRCLCNAILNLGSGNLRCRTLYFSYVQYGRQDFLVFDVDFSKVAPHLYFSFMNSRFACLLWTYYRVHFVSFFRDFQIWIRAYIHRSIHIYEPTFISFFLPCWQI